MTPTATAAPPPPAADPFHIGWRDVCRTLPDGSTTWEQVPLTLEDALHPQEGDTLVQNTLHDIILAYLRDVARCRVAGDPNALVLCDCKVLWPDGVHHSPDLSILFGVGEPEMARGEFDVAAEGQRPRLVIEVVSPSTRVNDIETKFADYHHYRVPLYVIVDRRDEDDPPELLGYQWTPRRYIPLPADEDGRLWLEPLGISLSVRDGRVVAYDGDTGEELGDYTAITAALAEEQARADAEQARADAEQARADAEKSRADAERVRADAEKGRADAEKSRAEAAETRLRLLEEQLAKQSRPPTA